ncbi:ABC transporter ATP-binding protein [Clostridium sp. C2-6-12]|uniref:ABC transporter ATP-binding protein n=1 Tax=Clostridium sp. C2-6-12 TaxID=2698832 RepID=UPI0013718971|nr:ABC transporter ATP-binding protein [Clostridium sp. C2-6-12]
MSDTVIKVENVSKVYKLYDKPTDRMKEALSLTKKKYSKEHYALNDISFEINEGEILGIIGTNGAGKSTILKIITGVLNATKGNVEVNGKISALLELGAGFNPEYTGIQNIYLNGTMMGYKKEEIDKKVELIADFAEIGEFIHQPVKTYSSGMFARLAFSVAVNIEPDILIIDEALAVGDLKFQQKAMRKMKELIKKSKAILFVSHDTTSIRNFCSRTIWLMNGKVFKDGDPKEITRLYDDYMTHGIIPEEDAENLIKKFNGSIGNITTEKAEYINNIEWSDTSNGNSIGGKEALIEKVAFYMKKPFKKVAVLENEDELVLFVDIIAFNDIKRPLLGAGIFNDRGVPIIHFNNYTLSKKIEAFKSGSRILLKFNIKIPKLRNGNYFIGLGLDDGEYGEHKVIHRVNEAYNFKVARTDRFSKQHGTIITEDSSIDIIEIYK